VATDALDAPVTEAARLRGESLHVLRGGKAILRGVTLEARARDVIAVVGPSGAGKSTLFRALVGELPVARGRVLLEGNDVSDWPLWRRAREGVGYIPQSPSVLFGLTVRANLTTFHRIVHGGRGTGGESQRTRGGADAYATEAARRVDLTSRLDVVAGELSAGERRRLELARALVRAPRVLLCDEPFAGVDPAGSERIARHLSELAHDGVAVVLADHHVVEALAVATRAVLLLDGELAAEEDPQSFTDHPLVKGRYLGSWARSIPP
jgi:lipopolysaccharide export system ATP-binding protein